MVCERRVIRRAAKSAEDSTSLKVPYSEGRSFERCDAPPPPGGSGEMQPVRHAHL